MASESGQQAWIDALSEKVSRARALLDSIDAIVAHATLAKVNTSSAQKAGAIEFADRLVDAADSLDAAMLGAGLASVGTPAELNRLVETLQTKAPVRRTRTSDVSGLRNRRRP